MNTSSGESGKLSCEAILPSDADYALLQEPLNVGIKNVKQILNCIQSGSKEIKDLILNECNIIYECRVCQNLFRSLANFLYHKRCFCKKHVCEGMLLFEHFEEPQAVQVQSELVCDEPKESDSITAEKNKTNENQAFSPTSKEVANVSPNEDILVESQSEPQSASEPTKETEVNEGQLSKDSSPAKNTENSAGESISKPSVTPVKIMGHLLKFTMKDRILEACKNVEVVKVLRKSTEIKPAVILKPIAGNTKVVLQEPVKKEQPVTTTVAAAEALVLGESNNLTSSDEDDDFIEILSVSDKEEKIEKKTVPKKNVAKKDNDIQLSRRKKLLNRADCLVPSLMCLKCVTQFTTLKTLYFHMMSLHSQKRLYYPCPFCKTLFVQMYGVTRHIIAVHEKTKEQIDNKLRETIRKGAIWKRVDESSLKNKDKNVCEKGSNEIEVISPIKEEKIQEEEAAISDPNDKTFHPYVKLESNVLALHQCSKCLRVFGRKSSQVSHQKFCIMNTSPTSDNSGELSVPSRDMYSDVKPDLLSITKCLNFVETKVNARPKRGAEKQMHKDFVNSQTLKWRSANKIETFNRLPPKSSNKNGFKTFERKIKSIVDSDKLLCLKCNRKFSSFSNLRRHAAIHIGWTRYECKTCNYQSYNKSDCRHHIERIHNVAETESEKFVIHLVSDITKNKIANNKVTTSKGKRKNFVINKAKIISKQKKKKKKSPPSSYSPNRDRSVSNSPSKDSNPSYSPVKDRSPPKRVFSTENSHSNESKKQKKSRIITVINQPHLKKPQGNYKSVTTNSPTTIILSKTGSNSSMQELKNSVRPSQKLNSSTSSIVQKTYEVKFMTETISKPSVIPRNSSYQSRIFSTNATSPNKPDIITVGNGLTTPDKLSIKKNRNISDWLIKKDKPPNMEFGSTSPIKRECAPVIIGLVAAPHTTPRIKAQNNKSPEKR